MNDWKQVEAAARRIADQEIRINSRISLIQMVSGNYKPAIDGNQTEPSELKPDDLNAIRRSFGIRAPNEFDLNPLIPDDGPPPKKKEKSENEFDLNPLIPDD